MERVPTEMELRVAKAIQQGGLYAGKPRPWESLDDLSHHSYVLMARAAICAMREPTPDMVPGASNGGAVYTDERSCPTCGQAGTATYRMYIDAASPPISGKDI